MSQRYATVPSTLDLRVRPPRPPPPSLPAAQRAEQKQNHEERNNLAREFVNSFIQDTNQLSLRMSQELGYSQRHCLDLLFCAGIRNMHARPNGNPYNAFIALKSRELQASKLSYFL
jgi:hypothetical protein